MRRPTIDVERYVRLCFRTVLDEETQQTKIAVDAVNHEYASRRTSYSGAHAAQLAVVNLEGAKALLEKTLVVLERDSVDMESTEFDGFWGSVGVELERQISSELRRRKSSVVAFLNVQSPNGPRRFLEIDQIFGQRAANMLSRLGERIEEVKMSQKLRGEGATGRPGSIVVRDSPGANVNTGYVGGSQVSNVSMSDSARILGQMREILSGDASLAPSERQDALAEVQVIEAQLQKTKPNGHMVKESLDVLAKVGSIGGFAIKLSELLGPLLLG
ncbi:hypothetical protein JKA73_30880 [Myxococcus xanthus]|uniref:hypothetical protein n=1 Tax=Myxococcus xanthus TaxID=34 RepID=UPI001916F42B|nr:hypothetical protein [Myxococcus xanthus]QQR43404.1 hypothetical protein JKA73_30880 [Myxococcus xanthus]